MRGGRYFFLDELLLLELLLLGLLLELELFDPPDLEADLAIYALLLISALNRRARAPVPSRKCSPLVLMEQIGYA